MSGWYRTIERAAVQIAWAAAIVVSVGIVTWVGLGIAGYDVSLPTAIGGVGLIIVGVAVYGGGDSRATQRPVPPPPPPARPRRTMTPEDLIIIDRLAERLITRGQLEAAVREAIPPVPPSEPADDGRRRGRR